MPSKKEVKDIQTLSLKKHRDETKLFIAEGPKIVEELLVSFPRQVVSVYALQEWIHKNQKLPPFFKVETISAIELEKISLLSAPNQVVAIIKQFAFTLPDVQRPVLYLDTIQDPGNFGTIIRIADWFGIQDIICSDGCADLYNPKVVQSSMGSMGRVQVYVDVDGSWIRNQKLPVFAASLQGKPLHQFNKIQKGIILIGNESKGLRKELLNLASEKIRIPGKGAAESLNAAVATGIILSHLID
ncbi:MAG: RNA methyltransferase [Flavisolibacter sp.]|jgi:TrmH family RNA methyltransferase|nr:RNA methyltransferase [Flavisolibacter sp.]